MKKIVVKRLLNSFSILTVLMLCPLAGFAGSYAWSINPTTSLFSGVNWTNTGVPGPAMSTATNGSGLFFGSTTLSVVTNDDSAFTFAGITFNSTASAYNINGNAFTLTSGIINNGITAQVINNDIALSGSQTMTANTGNITLGGVISGSSAIAKTGSGNLNLSGANTYSGTITIAGSSGTVTLQSSNALGTGKVAITKATTTTGTLVLQLSGANTITNTITASAATALDGGGTAHIENKSGSNTVTSPIAITTSGNGLNFVSDAGAGNYLTLSGLFSSTQSTPVISMGGTGDGAISGVISNTFSIRKIGTGTWTFTGSNVFNRNVTIYAGTLQLGNGGTSGDSSTAPSIALAGNGAALLLNRSDAPVFPNTVNLNGSNTIAVATGTTATLNGVISDPASSTNFPLSINSLANAGKLILSKVNTYTNQTVITAGTLALSGSGSIASSANISIASGATFDVSALSSSFTLGAAQTLTGSGATGTINGNANLSAGSLVLAYTNGTPTLAVTSGTLTLANNAVTVTVAGGTPLVAGIYQLIAAGTGGAVAGSVSTSTLTLNGAGAVAGATTSLIISNSSLYLVIANPVAATATVYRTAGSSLLIPVANIATNWTDGAGFVLSLTGVSALTTNAVSLSTNGANIFYPNSANVNDQFTYTISDNYGVTATGIINVVVNTATGVSGQAQSITVGGSSATVNFAGIPGYTYYVQRSTNLVSWVTIQTTNAPSGGLFNFTDTFSDLGGVPPVSAYYQLSSQP